MESLGHEPDGFLNKSIDGPGLNGVQEREVSEVLGSPVFLPLLRFQSGAESNRKVNIV